jgi:hypothetical protein
VERGAQSFSGPESQAAAAAIEGQATSALAVLHALGGMPDEVSRPLFEALRR